MHNLLPAHLFSSTNATDAELELGRTLKGIRKDIPLDFFFFFFKMEFCV